MRSKTRAREVAGRAGQSRMPCQRRAPGITGRAEVECRADAKRSATNRDLPDIVNDAHRFDRLFLVLGSLFGFLAVALGAFAAHALKARLGADLSATFEVGVRYQMYHALALLAVGLAHRSSPNPLLAASGWLFVVGIVVFSGSLYVLGLSGIRWFGAITPFGGIAFLAGWACLARAVWKQ